MRIAVSSRLMFTAAFWPEGSRPAATQRFVAFTARLNKD
jgi:hypothetical protein